MKKLFESDKIFFGGLFIIAAIVVVGALFIFSGNKQKPESNASLVGDNSQVLGEKDAKVTIVEFSDFQCTHCARVYPVVRKVLDSYSKEQVRFAFRNFPLGGNQYSIDAAVAAEAAGEQGKFWDYCSLIYENQTKLDQESLISYADKLHLNIDEFKKGLGSKTNKTTVLRDVSDGEKLGVEATPTFFINGTKYEGELSFDQFKSIIDAELKK